MKHCPLPTTDRIRESFDYHSDTGQLVWKKVNSPRLKVGDTVTSKDAKGYLRVMLDGVRYRAHRLIWKGFFGEDPGDFEIDHINGVRDDNRISNLRLVNDSQQAQNTKVRKTNKSGIKGVSPASRQGGWAATLRFKGKQNHLGYFKTKEEAAKVVQKARQQHHKEYAHH